MSTFRPIPLSDDDRQRMLDRLPPYRAPAGQFRVRRIPNPAWSRQRCRRFCLLEYGPWVLALIAVLLLAVGR